MAYDFYCNKECDFFPCHKTNKPEEFNCMFCYCPLYMLGEDCGSADRWGWYSDKNIPQNS